MNIILLAMYCSVHSLNEDHMHYKTKQGIYEHFLGRLLKGLLIIIVIIVGQF